MAHQVESMLYVGTTPWHELGVKLDAPPTSEEAIKAAGLDWEVGLKALQTVEEPHEGVSHNAIFRKSDGKILGVGGPDWTPLQNSAAFKWFDPFLQAGEATIECAGSLQGGRKVWILAKLARQNALVGTDDSIAKYILLAIGHDGVFGGRVGFTPIRVVCANTLSLATADGASQLLKIRHTKNVAETLEKVRDIMNTVDASFEAMVEQYRALARRNISSEDLEKYVKLVFKPRQPAVVVPSQAEIAAALAEPQTDALVGNLLGRGPSQAAVEAEAKDSRTLETIRELFETGIGSDLPTARGTYWGAYNAVTEFTTHHRGRSDENRLAAQLGDGAAINRRALTEAIKLAA